MRKYALIGCLLGAAGLMMGCHVEVSVVGDEDEPEIVIPEPEPEDPPVKPKPDPEPEDPPVVEPQPEDPPVYENCKYPDADGDTIADFIEGTEDTDGDTIPNDHDDDSDGDTIPDVVEAGTDGCSGAEPLDSDFDEVYDFLSTDSDGNGIPDSVEAGDDPENPVDTDGDGEPDYIDADNDNDGIDDIYEIEGVVAFGADLNELNFSGDCDGDTIPDMKGLPEAPIDCDEDGVPDYNDMDSDGDTIPDEIEYLSDSNSNGFLDRYSLDSDGDGIPDAEEVDELGEPQKTADNEYCFQLQDCDHDGLSDVVERECHCIINDVEEVCPTNPTLQDTDGDEAPDALECAQKTNPNDPASNPQAEGQFVFYAPYNDEITPKVQKLSFETAIQTVDMFYIFDSSWTMQEEAQNIKDKLPSMMNQLKCVQTTKTCTQNKDCDILEDNYLEGKSEEDKAKLKGAICSEKGVCIQNPAYEETVNVSGKDLKIEGCFDDMWIGMSYYTITDSFNVQMQLSESNPENLAKIDTILANKLAPHFNGNYEAAYQPPMCAVLNPGENEDLCSHKNSFLWAKWASFWISATEKDWTCNTDTVTKLGCAGFRKNAIRIILHAFDENQCLVYRNEEYSAFYTDSGVPRDAWIAARGDRCMRFKNQVGSILQNKRVRYIGLYSECYPQNLNMYDEYQTIQTVANKISIDSGSVDANGNPFNYYAFDADLANKAAEGVRSIAKNMPMTVTSDVTDIDVEGVSELVQLMDVIPVGGETVQNRICAEVQGTIKEEQECEKDNGVTKCDGIDNMLPGKVVCYNVVPVEKQTKFEPGDETKIYQARVMVKGDGSVLNSAIVNFVVPPKSYKPVN